MNCQNKMTAYGEISHESDIGFHLFASRIAHNMLKQPKGQWASIFESKTYDSPYDIEATRKQVKYYIKVSEKL